MNKVELDTIIEKYIEYSEIEGQSLFDGNYKLGNKMVKKLDKLFISFIDNCKEAEYIIEHILKSDCRRARILISVDALRIGIMMEQAVEELERASQGNDIFAFGSEMALKIWRGEIKGKHL